MVENLSETAGICNFHFLNRYGFKLAEKNWYFGKYKTNYLVLFGLWMHVIKCWLTVFYKDHESDNFILTNYVFELNLSIGASMFLIKFMLFLLKNKTIYNLTEMLKVDLIVFDSLDKRLEKDQKFCVKIARSVKR